MGYIDLKIDVTRGAVWRSRNLRMQSLKNPTKSLDNNEASTSSNCNNTNQSADNGASTSSNCNNNNQDECQNRMALGLYLAAKTGDVDALIDALERVSNEKNLTPSDLLDQVSPAGNTLLHLCVIYGNKEGAAFIANHFPTLLARPNSQGNTALHLAARAGDRELAETLIGILDDHQSGFSSASSSNSLNLSPSPEQLLVNLCKIRNKEGNTPLHESLVHGCRKSVAYFLIFSGRKDLNIFNDQDESPLYLAAKAGEAELAEIILIYDKSYSAGGRLKGKSACHAALLKREQGASLCIASKHIIPEELWINSPNPITVKVANGETVMITKVCKNLQIRIAGEIFHIPTIYQQESGIDLILGNNFCQLYGPFTQWIDKIAFTLENERVYITKVKKAFSFGKEGFLDSLKKNSKTSPPTPINISKDIIEENIPFKKGENEEIFYINLQKYSIIEEILEQVCSEDPIDPKKSRKWMTASIKLVDEKTIVRVKPMKYSPQDRIEFSKQIRELLDLGLIQPSKSPHMSPADFLKYDFEEYEFLYQFLSQEN